MSCQYNKVIICGNLGRDPFYKQREDGRDFCTFRLFVNRTYFLRDPDTGELVKKESVDCPVIQCWGKNAERMGKYLTKGRNVLIEGHIETHQWQDKADPKVMHNETVIMADDFKFIDSPRTTETTPKAYAKEDIPTDNSGEVESVSVDM